MKTVQNNLKQASDLVWEAVLLLKRDEYPQLRATLEAAFDQLQLAVVGGIAKAQNNLDRAGDLVTFLTHPQHWPGTDVILTLQESLSVLHYNPMLDKYSGM